MQLNLKTATLAFRESVWFDDLYVVWRCWDSLNVFQPVVNLTMCRWVSVYHRSLNRIWTHRWSGWSFTLHSSLVCLESILSDEVCAAESVAAPKTDDMHESLWQTCSINCLSRNHTSCALQDILNLLQIIAMIT